MLSCCSYFMLICLFNVVLLWSIHLYIVLVKGVHKANVSCKKFDLNSMMHLFAGKSDSPERSGGASLVYARKIPIHMYEAPAPY